MDWLIVNPLLKGPVAIIRHFEDAGISRRYKMWWPRIFGPTL